MMRFKLEATSSVPLSLSRSTNLPLSVTIKPANKVPGSFQYQTDSKSLLKLLRQKTDLSGFALDMFSSELQISRHVSLPGVCLKEDVLREIGYFID